MPLSTPSYCRLMPALYIWFIFLLPQAFCNSGYYCVRRETLHFQLYPSHSSSFVMHIKHDSTHRLISSILETLRLIQNAAAESTIFTPLLHVTLRPSLSDGQNARESCSFQVKGSKCKRGLILSLKITSQSQSQEVLAWQEVVLTVT